MAKVFPFHGYRYNQAEVGELEQLVTQPYDKIDDELQKEYYKKSPYNIVRLILNKKESPYEEAAKQLEKWIENRILVKDDKPSFYLYTQEYNFNGQKFLRKAFIGLGELENESTVKEHETTMAGPKADRLNLIRAAEANFGNIFMLYSDPKNEINKLFSDLLKTKAIFTIKDEDNNIHKLWQISDQNLIAKIQQKMKNKSLYIADGHHRYHTALNYRRECIEKGWKSVGVESFNHRLMTFVNMEDPGLKVLPTHRLLYGVQDFNLKEFLKKAAVDFEIIELKNKEDLFNYLDQNKSEKAFGFKAAGNPKYFVFKLKEEIALNQKQLKLSKEYLNLDVNIVHNILLEKYLAIGEKELAAKSNLDYIRYREAALNKLENSKYQAVFILNPSTVKEVKQIADQGEKMPQKSTDFYPKLLTGLVVNKLNIKK